MSFSNPIHSALFQPDIVWRDPQANMDMFENLFSKSPTNTNIFVLPEMFTTGFLTDPTTDEANWALATIQWMQKMAGLHQSAVCGSIIASESDQLLNRFVWASPNGDLFFYDKKHLFSLGKEHHKYAPGNKQLIIHYNGWRIKPLICYDLRFPVWARNRFLQNAYEYDLLIVSANWPSSRHEIWKTLLMARAIENQAYVVGVNRSGNDQNGWNYLPDSAIAAPWGKWICSGVDEVLNASFDKNDLMQYRNNFPFAQDWDRFDLFQ